MILLIYFIGELKHIRLLTNKIKKELEQMIEIKIIRLKLIKIEGYGVLQFEI